MTMATKKPAPKKAPAKPKAKAAPKRPAAKKPAGKRPAAKIGRRKYAPNPVSAADRASLDQQAVALYEQFTGHPADSYQRVELPDLRALVLIGEIEAIAYNTRRDGKRGRYLHPFKRGSRPLLCVTADGQHFIALGGAFEFGEHGFEDK